MQRCSRSRCFDYADESLRALEKCQISCRSPFFLAHALFGSCQFEKIMLLDDVEKNRSVIEIEFCFP